MKLSTLIGIHEILCVSIYISIYCVDISDPICKKVRLLVQKLLPHRKDSYVPKCIY